MNLVWSEHHNLQESSSSFSCTYFKGPIHLQMLKSVTCCTLLELAKSRPFILQGPISLFCFTFPVQHRMKMMFSPHSKLVLMRPTELFKWWGKQQPTWFWRQSFHFHLKNSLRYNCTGQQQGFVFLSPSTHFTNCMRTNGARVSS